MSPEAAEALRALSEPIRVLSESWAVSPLRPRPTPAVLDRWDRLIDAWVECDLPLVLRLSKHDRGSHEDHVSGRALTFSDNTLAHWAFALALRGETPGLGEVRELFQTQRMPLAFAIKQREKPRLAYTRGGLSVGLRLNAQGWKVCHLDRVSEGGVIHPRDRDLKDITAHFRRFVAPRNMFLVPLTLGGLGEAPEMIAAIRRYDHEAH